MDGLYFALLIGTGVCLFMSLRTLFVPNRMRGSSILSLENFLYLGMVYFTVLVGFGMVYLLFGLYSEPVLAETGGSGDGSFLRKAGTAVYFSAMTLFSVGHGDVVPIGIGRFVAILEALIGYTIPAAFVARAVMERD
ncbi:ion channel [Neobacillus sp. YIM B06451]|uniref:ion channel n=1 Tax=Neobacillus sp. YIM B06451 TaxID=3070994 RepID=UPI0037CB718D